MKLWGMALGVIIFGLIVARVGLVKMDIREKEWQQQEETRLKEIDQLKAQIETWEQSDQVKVNLELKQQLTELKKVLRETIKEYEAVVDLRASDKQIAVIDHDLAKVLADLAEEKYASASSRLTALNDKIKKEADKRAVAAVPAAGATGSETVKTNNGEFQTRIISVDLSANKIVVETASDKDCKDNCPVMSLASLAARSGAWAAINGPYFCPASYPSCADKKNSFDTLLMNRSKYYFNSDNNVYSNVPAAIFSTSSRFVTQSSQWGRDTGVDSVIAGQPLLVFNGQSQFGGDGDPKKSSKGTRAFIGATDKMAYIGLVYNVTVAEMAQVIAAKGIRNAINLDSGGSIAMWQNGKYVAGPGRDLPFGIMVVKR